MSYYLLEHPNPNKTQYRPGRRATPTGAIVIHTPEAGVDLAPPDTKAIDVLRFISRRDSYGSYHAGVDSDSIDLGAPWSYEVWGAGPRSPYSDLDDEGNLLRANSIAIHLFVACDHDQWQSLPIVWVEEAIQRLAILAANAADWLQAEHGILVPARFGTAEDFWRKRPGFYTHATIDPDRRRDPGPEFPRDLFLDEYQQAAGHIPNPKSLVERIQTAAKDTGYSIDVDGVLDERDAAAVENMAAGIVKLIEQDHPKTEALNQAEAARAAAVSRAAELDAQLADAVAARAEMHDRTVALERFLGRVAGSLNRLDQLRAESAEILETARSYVDDVSQHQPKE